MPETNTILLGDVDLYSGDCLEVLPTLPKASADSVVTDPPYGIKFMGKGWDHGVPGERFWREALRVAKPGAHLLAFGGTRTHHRLACAIEDAGWEIRDTVMWVYGSGFPKSHNVGKALDGAAWQGWGTALKPAWEPIIVARKPITGTVAANVQKHGPGALNIDGCRIETQDNLNGGAYSENGARHDLPGATRTATEAGMMAAGTTTGKQYTQPEGRFPANLIHDGGDEVLALFPETTSGKQAKGGHVRNPDKHRGVYQPFAGNRCEGDVLYGDTGSAARFFYCAKANKADRGEGNTHPTVKPSALMRYLCRLVTPPGGVVLDPFMGSGSTGKAATQEGFCFIGIEVNPEYVDMARRRTAQQGLGI